MVALRWVPTRLHAGCLRCEDALPIFGLGESSTAKMVSLPRWASQLLFRNLYVMSIGLYPCFTESMNNWYLSNIREWQQCQHTPSRKSHPNVPTGVSTCTFSSLGNGVMYSCFTWVSFCSFLLLTVFLFCFVFIGKNFNLVANFLKRHFNLRCILKQLYGGT